MFNSIESEGLVSFHYFYVDGVTWVNRTLKCGFCLQYRLYDEAKFEEAFGFKSENPGGAS